MRPNLLRKYLNTSDKNYELAEGGLFLGLFFLFFLLLSVFLVLSSFDSLPAFNATLRSIAPGELVGLELKKKEQIDRKILLQCL